MARRPPSKPERPFHTVDQKRLDIDRLSRRIKELEAFDPQSVTKRFGDPKVTEIETAIDETLAAVFGHGTVEYDRYSPAARLDHGPVTMSVTPSWIAARGGGYSGPQDQTVEAREYIAEGKQQALGLLRQAVRGLEEDIGEQEALAEPEDLPYAIVRGAAAQQSETTISPCKVFIVHGHDEGPREAVARFIERLGFEAIILHERPNKGRTIITKFREEAAGVGFAVVLMTPDDLGKAKETADLVPRARQNVIFELGFFIGALRPEHVAALVKGEIDLPSDYDGVIFISMDKEDWRTKLAKELEAAHYEIDWNKVMR